MNISDGSPRTRRLRRLAAPVAALAIALAACGSDDEAQPDDAPAATTDDSDTSTPTEGDAGIGEALQQNSTITVEGTPLVPYDQTIPDDSIGTAAPLVSGESFDGTAMTIGGATDNPTMVVFLAHWCPHCNDEIPELLELEEAGALPENLDIIAVSTAVAEDRDNYPPSEWLEEKGWPWAAMADDMDLTAINAFGGTSFPFTTILDADGNVLARRGGSAPADVIQSFVDDALA